MEVSAAGGLTVDIAPGSAAIPTANNTGSVLCVSDAIEQLLLLNAPASGLSRVDLVLCSARGADLDGGINNDWIFSHLEGVEVASGPVPPAIPLGSVGIAQVNRPGGSAAIAQADIVDIRKFGLAVTGSDLPPPVTSGSAVQSFTDATGEVWVAKNGVNGGAWRKARDVIFSHWYRNAAYTVTTGGSVLGFDQRVKDDYGLFTGQSTFTAPIPGIYELKGHWTGTGGQVANSNYCNVHSNLQGDLCSQNYGNQHSWGGGPTAVVTAYLVAGEQITITVSSTNAAGVGGQGGKAQVFMSAKYMGTG
jgi:hypothetical protein